MIDIGTLGGNLSGAIAVNDRGQVVGFSSIAGDVETHAFSWTASRGMIDLGTLGGESAIAMAVNRRGDIVGYSYTAGNASVHAVLWPTRRDRSEDEDRDR